MSSLVSIFIVAVIASVSFGGVHSLAPCRSSWSLVGATYRQASRRPTPIHCQGHHQHQHHRQLSTAGVANHGYSALNLSSDSSATSSLDVAPQKRRLTREFFAIAFPAFLQLAAEPLAGLVDTAYLGRLGPEVLGGAGVAISAQYAVSKLYNDPLLRTSISLVASEDGRRQEGGGGGDAALSVAVSSALLLAFAVGAVQLVMYFSSAGPIIRGMGVGPSSPMHPSALSYLRVRALGTPAATLWLVGNGIFRGLGDTATPLKYALLFTTLNALMDPLFIFTLGWGASGAAAGTALAQYIALIPLLMSLSRRVDLRWRWRELGGALKEYVRAGSYVFLRTVGKVLAYSVCARQAVSGSRHVKDSTCICADLTHTVLLDTSCSADFLLGVALCLRRCLVPSPQQPTTSLFNWALPPRKSASRSQLQYKPCWHERQPAAVTMARRRKTPHRPPCAPSE